MIRNWNKNSIIPYSARITLRTHVLGGRKVIPWEWKRNPHRKPLIVKGARQVGKTESIQRFGKNNYKSVISINFVEEPKFMGKGVWDSCMR